MKVSTNQYFATLSRHLGEQQGRIAELQAKLATGDNMVTPGTAPRLAARSLDLNSIIGRQQGFLDNLTTLDARLQNEETVVMSMRQMVLRMQELAVRAANDTYSAADRAGMAVELQGYRDEILALSNSTDASGNYLFGGIRNSTRPFVVNDDGQVVYQGDQTATEVEVDTGHTMRINTTEQDLFPLLERPPVEDDGDAPERVSVFRVFDEAIAAFRTSDTDGIGSSLAEITDVADGLDRYLVDIGVRRNIVEAKTDITTERKLAMEKLLSSERDLDYAQAVTQLSSEMLALEAAQSSIAKISQLSLFNYLR